MLKINISDNIKGVMTNFNIILHIFRGMVITAIMGTDPLDMSLAPMTLEVDAVTTVNMALDMVLEGMVVVMGDMVDMAMVDTVAEGVVADMVETGITGDMVPV